MNSLEVLATGAIRLFGINFSSTSIWDSLLSAEYVYSAGIALTEAIRYKWLMSRIQDTETAWFDPVLAFANPRITNLASTEKFFQILTNDAGGIRIQKVEKATLTVRFELPGLRGDWRSSVSKYEGSHGEEIREILGALAKYQRVTPKVWERLRELVGEVKLVGSLSLGPKSGDVPVHGEASVTGLTQWLALLIVELIDRGFGGRVRMCELLSCKNFFVAWRTKGPQQRYCSTNHASQHRVQRKRKRDQERGRL